MRRTIWATQALGNLDGASFLHGPKPLLQPPQMWRGTEPKDPETYYAGCCHDKAASRRGQPRARH